MKILHVAETIKGGVASYLNETLPFQCNTLESDNIRILLPADHQDCLDNSLKPNILSFPRNGRSIKGFLNLTHYFLKALKNETPDIVFFHSTFAGFFGRAALFFGYTIWGRKHPKIMYCAHGWVFSTTNSTIKKKLYMLAEKFLGNHITDKVIVISKSEEKLALEAGIKPEKLALIYNGISPIITNAVKNKQTNRPANLLFIGRFDHAKGLDILLKAIETLDQSKFTLTAIGESVDNNKALNIPDNVITTGWVTREKAIEYLAQADALIMPSRWEGFGLVAVEAMACKTAVIASDASSLPEQVEHQETGYIFKSEDSSELAEIIEKAYSDIHLLHQMGEAGHQKFLNSFKAKKMNQAIILTYKSIL